MANQRSSNFAVEFLDKQDSKPQKKIDFSLLRKGLKLHLSSITFTTFSIINHRRYIIDHLESHFSSKYC